MTNYILIIKWVLHIPKYFISNTVSATNLKLQFHHTHQHLYLLNRSIQQWIFRSKADKTLHIVSTKTVAYHGMVHWQRTSESCWPNPLLYCRIKCSQAVPEIYMFDVLIIARNKKCYRPPVSGVHYLLLVFLPLIVSLTFYFCRLSPFLIHSGHGEQYLTGLLTIVFYVRKHVILSFSLKMSQTLLGDAFPFQHIPAALPQLSPLWWEFVCKAGSLFGLTQHT